MSLQLMMMVFRLQKKIILVSLVILPSFVLAQNIQSEDHSFDCNSFKRITVPFDHSDTNCKKNGYFLKKIEFSSKTHRTSDWYRIHVKDSCHLSFYVNALNKSDSFDISLYSYIKGNDFCNDVYENNVGSGKFYFYGNIKKIALFNSKGTSFSAKTDLVYYLCIYSTTINNCGHLLYLNNGNDTLIMRSSYLPCNKDTATLKINNFPEKKEPQNLLLVKAEEKKKTSIPISKKTTTATKTTELIPVKCIIVDAKKKLPIEGKLTIIDELTGIETKVEENESGHFNIIIEPNKNYKVSCVSIGYKSFDHSVIINKAINSNNEYSILLSPLKAGNNFTMHNIYFHPNTYALKPESQEDLPSLFDYLTNNPEVKIEIQGYTNGDKKIRKNKAFSKLGVEWNFEGSAQKLSKLRAEMIKKYLLQQGINSERIKTKGFGGSKMIIKRPKTMEDVQQNIRVEVLILES